MGTKILYYLIILPISYLPYPILYGMSDFAYFVGFVLIGYRKKVVLGNIQRSFPEKSDAEHKKIMRKFYHHFFDLIVESLKGFTVSEKQIRKRMKMGDDKILHELKKTGRDIILVGGHYNNWEIFAHGIGLYCPQQPIGIYKPLKNQFFNQKMLDSRQKFGLLMCSMKETKQYFDQDFDKPKMIIFGSDQSPSNAAKAYWMNFLNQETGVLFGAEKYAKDYNYPVVYGRINKVKRGHYTVDFSLVTEHPQDEPYGMITQKHTKELEKDIVDKPEYWLWSHKRWKRTRPEGIELHDDLK